MKIYKTAVDNSSYFQVLCSLGKKIERGLDFAFLLSLLMKK